MTNSNKDIQVPSFIDRGKTKQEEQAIRYSDMVAKKKTAARAKAKWTKTKSNAAFVIIMVLLLLGLYFVIYSAWTLAEIKLLGSATPNNVDTIVAIVLTFSLFGNLLTFIGKEK